MSIKPFFNSSFMGKKKYYKIDNKTVNRLGGSNSGEKSPSKQNKDCIIITRFPYTSAWGGEESHTLNLAQHLKKQGHEVVFMGSCPIMLERFQEQGFKTYTVWGSRMIVTPWELIKSFFLFPFIIMSLKKGLLQIIKDKKNYHLYCLSLNEKLFLSGTVIKKSIPMVWVEHQQLKNWLIKSPWSYLYKKYAKKAKIVPISKYNKNILEKKLGINSENIFDITHGINLKEIYYFSQKKESRKILAANRMIPKKGMLYILKALHKLIELKVINDATLLGDGPEKKKVREYIKENHLENSITVHSFLEKKDWLNELARTDIYISAATDENETFSLNSAEALASGCKLIVTECSGISHTLSQEDNQEKSICIIPPQDSNAIVEAVKKCITLDEKAWGNSKSIAQKLFDDQRMYKQYEKLLFS